MPVPVVTIVVPITTLWTGVLGAHALAVRREKRFGASWAWGFLAVFPAVLSSVFLTIDQGTSVEIRNIILGIVGALVGAIGAIAAGYWFAAEAVAQPTQPQATNAAVASNPPISITGGNSAISYGQTGGVTAQTYINQVPVTSLMVIGEDNWKKIGADTYEKDVAVKLLNPGGASKVKITVYGDNVLNVGFFGEGMMATGGGGNGDGFVWKELMTPNSIRGFSIIAKKPVPVRIETAFN